LREPSDAARRTKRVPSSSLVIAGERVAGANRVRVDIDVDPGSGNGRHEPRDVRHVYAGAHDPEFRSARRHALPRCIEVQLGVDALTVGGQAQMFEPADFHAAITHRRTAGNETGAGDKAHRYARAALRQRLSQHQRADQDPGD